MTNETLGNASAVPVTLTVNGRRVAARVEPRLHLADFLRDHLRLTGTHLGCEHGICGACTVLIDGVPARSCIAYTVACDNLEVRTIEGFEEDESMALLREAFSREHGLQCGFCTPGMLITSRDILHRLPHADEKRVRLELSGNLCRCTGYKGIVNAVCAALKDAKDHKSCKEVPQSASAVRTPAFTVFKPASIASVPASSSARPSESVSSASRNGSNRFEESFILTLPPERVWRAFADLPMVAACLPGAELQEHDANSVKGCIRVKLGPIVAAFSGSASIERDEASMSGRIKGAGSDARSASRTRGEVTYKLAAEDNGKSTRVVTVVEYNLQGTLAQFSRSSLAREFGRTLVAQLAANLNERLGANGRPGGGQGRSIAAASVPSAPLNVWRLLWMAVVSLFRGRSDTLGHS